MIQRGVEPQIRKWALAGGYVDYGETWQQGAARELYEETGIVHDAKVMEHFETVSSAKGEVIVIFALAPAIAVMPELRKSEEVLDVSVICIGDAETLEFISGTCGSSAEVLAVARTG